MAKKKQDHEFNVRAFQVVQKATEAPEEPKPKAKGKNLHAVALGRLGGLKGGKARAKKMTPEQRKEAARKASQKR